MSSQERRVFHRIPFDADTQIRQGEQSWSAVLIDLSLKGLLIEKPQGCDIAPEQATTARIILNGDTTIDMSIRLRHDNNGQLGFECQHIDIDSISHLRRLLELNLGDSQLLERELGALGT